MEQILQQILSKLDNLEAGQQELRYDVRALKAGQEKLEAGQKKLEAGQQRLEAEQQKVNERLDNIEKDTVLIPSIKQAVSEVNQEDQQVQETLDRHEITLGALSARSLEHEVKLS